MDKHLSLISLVFASLLFAGCGDRATPTPPHKLRTPQPHTARDASLSHLAAARQSPPDAAIATVDAKSQTTGRVKVKVTWPKVSAKLRRPAVSKTCRTLLPPPVNLHTLGGVQNAVVILESQSSSRATPSPHRLRTPSPPITTVIHDCSATPAISVGNVGTILQLESLAATRKNIVIEKLGARKNPFAVFSLALMGQSAALRLPNPGTFRIRTNAKEQAQAHIVITPSDTYAITNHRGEVLFDAIPPGPQTITVVHQPLPKQKSLPTVTAKLTVQIGQTKDLTIPLKQ